MLLESSRLKLTNRDSDDMKAAGILLYLFKITAPLEEILHFLKQTPPSVKGTENAKRVILLDDMSVKPHSRLRLLLIPWTGTRYSGLPSNSVLSPRQLMSTYARHMTPESRKTIDRFFMKHANNLCRWHIIPICATSGENILEISSQSPWYKAQNDAMVRGKTRTVIDALDA